jgi:hypothetical protein
MEIFNILKISFYQLFITIGIVFLAGFIINFFKNHTISNFHKSLGNTAILATGLVGTPIHEIGHALMCILFGHKINAIKFFSFNPKNNVLGYVNHSYRKNSLYQRIGLLFIALGPIFSGVVTIILLLKFLLPSSYNIFINNQFNTAFNFSLEYILALLSFGKDTIYSIFDVDNFKEIKFWIFILTSASISIHMSLSKKDLEGFWRGLIAFFLLIVILNSLFVVGLNIPIKSFIGIFNLINIYLISALILSILSSAVAFSISLILSMVFNFKK